MQICKKILRSLLRGGFVKIAWGVWLKDLKINTGRIMSPQSFQGWSTGFTVTLQLQAVEFGPVTGMRVLSRTCAVSTSVTLNAFHAVWREVHNATATPSRSCLGIEVTSQCTLAVAMAITQKLQPARSAAFEPLKGSERV